MEIVLRWKINRCYGGVRHGLACSAKTEKRNPLLKKATIVRFMEPAVVTVIMFKRQILFRRRPAVLW